MNNEELVHRWTAKTRERLRAAELLLENDSPEAAVNRLYYAALGAVTTVLAQEGVSVESHKAAVRLLGLHFIRPGRVSPEHGRLFKDLQEHRDAADYDGLVPVEEAELRTIAERTRHFVDAVLGLLDDN